ncbi:MAG: ATP-binding cassette domain-containing protein [Oscillospiraceae bacterium]|nr:ATP-binding cassette domain-containing protein [Oscillospiraceae bacterium]
MQLEMNDVSFRYSHGGRWILKDVSLCVQEGERVGLIGPSGYGKSTLAKLLSGYEKPYSGEILLDGRPLPKKGVCPVQLIYQHPEKAINPRWKMRKVLEESGQFREEMMEAIGIERDWLDRYPRELSGGELQRFCVARSLFEGTRFLIADEMSTMLDVITQAQIWDLMLKEVERRNLGLIVVTHNNYLAQRVCTRLIHLEEINHIQLTMTEAAEYA